MSQSFVTRIYKYFIRKLEKFTLKKELCLVKKAKKNIYSGQYEVALELYDRALTKVKKPEWLAQKAWLLYKLNQYDESEKIFQSIINTSNVTANWLLHYADLLLALKKEDGAVMFYKKALVLNNNLPRAHASLSRLLAYKGNIINAISHMKLAVELDSTHADWLAELDEMKEMDPYNSAGFSKQKNEGWYNTVYDNSDEYIKNYKDSIYINVWNEIISVITKMKCDCILDIGCGSGQLASAIKNETDIKNYNGLDFSSSAINIAKKRELDYNFFVADALNFPFEDYSQCDLMIITEVLEHIEDDLGLLERLPKNIKIISSVPNFDSASHLRFFSSVDEVRIRYEKYFTDLLIEEVSIGPMSIIYLMVGRKI